MKIGRPSYTWIISVDLDRSKYYHAIDKQLGSMRSSIYRRLFFELRFTGLIKQSIASNLNENWK